MSASSLLSDSDGGPIETVPSLWYYLRHGFQVNPDGVAVIAEHQKSARIDELLGTSSNQGEQRDESLICTYKQLYNGCLKLCAGLIKQGVQPGDTITVLIPQGIENVLVMFAASLLKLTLAMLDPGSLLPARQAQLLGFLKIITPNVVVVSEAAEAKVVEEAIRSLGTTHATNIIVAQSSTMSSTSWKSFAEVMQIGAANPVDEKALQQAALHDDPERTAWIFFTSGTSAGSPKGCPRTVHSIAHYCANVPLPVSAKQETANSKLLIATANYRIAAGVTLFTTLRNGYTVVFSSPVFDPGAFIRTIEKRQVDTTTLIPSQFYEVAQHPEFSPDRVKSVTMMGIGGDIVTKRNFEMIKRMFPSVHLHRVAYAMTEGAGWVMAPFPPSTPVDQIPFLDDICPVGKVKPGTRVRIWDPESKEVVRRGEAGELIIHSRSIIPQYLGSDTANANGFFTDEQGLRWFRTGDRATMTDPGLIYVIGRTSSIFNRGGIPVDPVPLERSIASFMGIDQMVCIVPMPSQRLGHVPLAVVSSLAGKDKREVLDHIIKTFGEAYALGDVFELQDLGLDTWPINEAGKLMKMDILAAITRSGCVYGLQ